MPGFARSFRDRYPEVWKAYTELGEAAGRAGPMDERTIHLVKLGIAIGSQSEGSVHSHTRRALAEGIPPEELEQIALLAITTTGFSRAMAALSWIADITRQGARSSE